MSSMNDFTARDIDGVDRKLSEFGGKVCLVVNVASECGLTPQYDGLQRLYGAYRDQGFEILAFPCNQFGGQEPAEESGIKAFCTRNFGVEFPLFGKIEVNGPGRDPLFAWLCADEVGPDASGDIAWNFAKFLIDQEGGVVARFAPSVEPCSRDITDRLDSMLEKS